MVVAMSLKVVNLRLELDESEAALPERLSERLGLGRDAIGRGESCGRAWTRRRHDDLHFVYAAEVEVPDAEAWLARAQPSGVERFASEHFAWPEPGKEPLASAP